MPTLDAVLFSPLYREVCFNRTRMLPCVPPKSLEDEPCGEYHSLLPPTWEIGLRASCAGARPFVQLFACVPAMVEVKAIRPTVRFCSRHGGAPSPHLGLLQKLQALPAQVTTWHSVLCTGQPSCPKILFSRDISRAPSPSGGLQCPQKKPRPLLHDSRPSPP